MELNRQSGANNVTPSSDKEENVAGIQVSGGRISDSADGEASRQMSVAASTGNATSSPKKLEESIEIQVAGGRMFNSTETEILASGVSFDATPPSSAKPNNRSTGVVVAGETSTSGNGTTCHQCRQSSRTSLVACKNQRKNKQCCIKICDRCLWNRYEEKTEEVGALTDWSCPKCRGICNCSVCRKRKGQQPTGVLHKQAKATDEKEAKTSRSEGLDANDNSGNEDLVVESENDNEEEEKEEEVDIPLPAGMELTSVAGIDVPLEDVGNALQFLEFCLVFEEILELTRGEAEHVLRELLHGGTASPGKIPPTVQFQIHLLSLLTDPSDGENSWFQTLKSLLKPSDVDSLLMAEDYDSLNASAKLRVLNLLCDEVLGTEKFRNWIENENNKFLQRVKEAKRKAQAAKGKEKSLKQKMKEDVRKAIIAKDGAPLSISEHEAMVSCTKSEAAQAHAGVLESQSILMKSTKTCDALRIEPLFMEHHGNVYWKLNSLDQSYVLQQKVGQGDTLSLDEKWYALDASGIEMIEKHMSSRGKNSRKRRAPVASSSQP